MNIYIETWKKIISLLLNTKRSLLNDYTLSKETNDIRELASKQLKLLDEARPNKEKSIYSQANEQQKEFIDYLEKVILYGNIEGKNNICLQ